MFAEFMNQYGMELIALILTALFGVFGMILKRLAQRWLDTGDKRALAITAVRFVEQVFHDLHGADKMQEALNKFSELLAEHNIICSSTEMEALLEAAVNEMNAQAKK